MKPPNLHLQRRMKQRRISAEEIDEVLGDPETEYQSQEDISCRVILGTTANGRRLKVVVREDDRQTVITVADRDN